MKIAVPTSMPIIKSRIASTEHLLLFFLCSFTFLIYIRGINSQFVAEDFIFLQIISNPFGEVWRIIQESSRMWPVAIIYRWLIYQLSGMTPYGYHLASIVLHLINVVLVFHFVKRISSKSQLGLVAALIFALYPRHHQPVLWMSASHFMLASLFVLICLNTYLRFLETGRISWYIWSMIALLMALFSQEGSVILLPILIFLELFMYFREKPFSRQVLAKIQWMPLIIRSIPILLIFVFFAFLTFGGNRLYKLTGIQLSSLGELNAAGFTIGDAYTLSIGSDSIREIASYVVYSVYPHIPLRALDPTVFTIILTILTIFFLTVAFIKGPGIIRLSLACLFVSILPYVFFTPFGNADRYFYFISVSVSILAAFYLIKLSDIIHNRIPSLKIAILTPLLAIFILISALMINQRINEWQAAGRIAEDILEEAVAIIPNPEAGSTIVYVGLPQQYGQAYLFMSAFSTAVQMKYGPGVDDVKFFQTHDQNAIDYLRDASPVQNPVKNIHVLLYEDGHLYDKSDSVADLDDIIPGSFFQW
ncbi:MAG TPA: hypothetical protein VLH85_04905 [Levilinea sp.]|nr:hypothetical protein [Levilinea sp.]